MPNKVRMSISLKKITIPCEINVHFFCKPTTILIELSGDTIVVAEDVRPISGKGRLYISYGKEVKSNFQLVKELEVNSALVYVFLKLGN